MLNSQNSLAQQALRGKCRACFCVRFYKMFLESWYLILATNYNYILESSSKNSNFASESSLLDSNSILDSKTNAMQ